QTMTSLPGCMREVTDCGLSFLSDVKGIVECVMSDQVVLGVRQRQQAFPLGGGQDGTTWHIY
ncbi:hypothetical protein, partial [Escherichia coli]|uniref:hypothetical protein n=1 Tax=Escherichia coli TaxID=562 RepID=UPI001BFE7234